MSQQQKSKKTTSSTSPTFTLSLSQTPNNYLLHLQNVCYFDKHFEQLQSQFARCPNRVYYLVSCKFVQRWRNLLGIEVGELPLINQELVEEHDRMRVKVKYNIKENVDFYVVDHLIWEMLGEYQIYTQIKRISYLENKKTKTIPIQTTQTSYMVLSQQKIKVLKANGGETPKIQSMHQISDFNSLHDVILGIRMKEGLMEEQFRECCCRLWWYLWKNDTQLMDQISQAHKVQEQIWEIQTSGELLQELDHIKQSYQVCQGFFVLEVFFNNRPFMRFKADIDQSNEHDNWYQFDWHLLSQRYSNSNESRQIYNSITYNNNINNENKFLINSQSNQIYTSKYNSNKQQARSLPPVQEVKLHGLVGLTNLGNTCYLNSVLQCLSHTKQLTQYFLNIEANPYLKVNLVSAYALFVKAMWCEGQSVYSPQLVKQNIKGRFGELNQQEDSYQLLQTLIDGLDEELINDPNMQNSSQEKIPNQRSRNYELRDRQSVISRLIRGEQKQQLTCPDCKHKTTKLNSFTSITLSIPTTPTIPKKRLTLLVLYPDFNNQTQKITISYTQIFQIVGLVAERLELNPNDFLCYVLTNNIADKIYGFNETSHVQLAKLLKQRPKLIYVIVLSDFEKKLVLGGSGTAVTCKFTISKKLVWVKFPLFFDLKKTTGKDLRRRALKYLYKSAYKQQRSIYKVEKQQNELGYMQRFETKTPFIISRKKNKDKDKNTNKNSQIQFILQDESLSNININQQLEIDFMVNQKFLQYFDFSLLDRQSAKRNRTYSDIGTGDYEVSQVSLQNCLRMMGQDQILGPYDKWRCHSCNQPKQATIKKIIQKFPQILILHLNRFSSCPSNPSITKKNSQPISIPKQLTIPTSHTQSRYKLYAMINHMGNIDGGHYTAYAENNGAWYNFDDAIVKSVDHDHDLFGRPSSQPYVLFYQRL